ncbi:ABC transporter substrate-binding protein [Natronobiforma cellulositropha]|uniref:ABC transporter substrate-binding protein n=1 Tax=Natronobiforma cellulositropha TaxID=1679076 RepID=UPI0021D5C6E4|nr:ABC transporter substrate-binding protein [Natronobiforma cellulositropha]
MPKKQQWHGAISRRQAIALTGAAGVGALAGCTGNGDDDDESPEDIIGNGGGNGNGGTATDYDEDYEDNMNEVTPGNDVNPFGGEYIFNTYHTGWNPGDVQEMSYEYLTVYNTATGEFVPRIAEDWDHDQDAGLTRVYLNDDYGWSDGSPVTAHDFVTSYKLAAYLDQEIGNYVNPEDITTDGDYAFQLQLRDDYRELNEELWFNQFLESLLSISEAEYGEFVERFDDADGEDEISSIQEDVASYDPHWDDALFSGPFVWVEANEQFADQVPNPHHPIAKDWDFYLRHGMHIEEAGLRAEEVDFVHQEATLQDLPDIYEEAPVSFSGQVFTLLFGPENEWIRDYPEVRQAIAHAVDFENIVEVAAPGTPVDPYSGGIDSGYIEHFVHDDVLDAMTNYAPADTGRATELLEGAGFSLDDDEWYTPDDEQFELFFPVGDWFGTPSEMAYNNLAEFGIEVDYFMEEMGIWNADHGDSHDYDISMHLNYGQSRQYHAHSDLNEELFGTYRGAVTEREMFDEVVEVPEVGNPDGDMVTIDLRENVEALAVAQSEDEVLDLASELAWAHNYLLPGAMIHPWSEHYWVNTGEWDFDIESDDWMTSNRITHYFIENGLQPR